jgi:hypothetical protein
VARWLCTRGPAHGRAALRPLCAYSTGTPALPNLLSRKAESWRPWRRRHGPGLKAVHCPHANRAGTTRLQGYAAKWHSCGMVCERRRLIVSRATRRWLLRAGGSHLSVAGSCLTRLSTNIQQGDCRTNQLEVLSLESWRNRLRAGLHHGFCMHDRGSGRLKPQVGHSAQDRDR